jgi:hypothetical protein
MRWRIAARRRVPVCRSACTSCPYRHRRDLARPSKALHGGDIRGRDQLGAWLTRVRAKGFWLTDHDVFGNDEHVCALSIMGAQRSGVDVQTRVLSVFHYRDGAARTLVPGTTSRAPSGSPSTTPLPLSFLTPPPRSLPRCRPAPPPATSQSPHAQARRPVGDDSG